MTSKLAILFIILGIFRSSAMIISGGLERVNNRFYSGVGKAFLGNPYDWSGVGKGTDGRRFATMISPRYFLTAAHYPVSLPLRFYEDNTTSLPHDYSGSFVGQILDPISGDPTDLYLGRLNSPISSEDNIAFYPILLFIDQQTGFLDLDAYIGLQFFMYAANANDLDSRGDYLGINTIDLLSYFTGTTGPIPTYLDYFIYNSGIQYEATGQRGDSGGPSLVPVGNSLALIGTHFTIATEPTATLDAFVPFYYSAIWDAMANDPANAIAQERPTALVIYTNVIPEPGSLTLLSILLIGCGRRRFQNHLSSHRRKAEAGACRQQ